MAVYICSPLSLKPRFSRLLCPIKKFGSLKTKVLGWICLDMRKWLNMCSHVCTFYFVLLIWMYALMTVPWFCFISLKKITISLRYSMESDRVIPPAFLLLRLLGFFFLRQDLIVYSLLVWNSQIGIYQAGLELIDICLLLPPECWDSRHSPLCSVSVSIWEWDCFSYHLTFMFLLEFQDLFFSILFKYRTLKSIKNNYSWGGGKNAIGIFIGMHYISDLDIRIML